MLALLLAFGLAAPAVPVVPIQGAPRLAAEVGQGKPTVLHFWATWCGACVDEFPRLRGELQALQQRGVAVALVSIDQPEDAAKVQAFLERFGLQSFQTMILDAPDPAPVAKAVGDKRWDGTLPATFVFDGRGRLSKGFIGRTSARALDAAAARLKR